MKLIQKRLQSNAESANLSGCTSVFISALTTPGVHSPGVQSPPSELLSAHDLSPTLERKESPEPIKRKNGVSELKEKPGERPPVLKGKSKEPKFDRERALRFPKQEVYGLRGMSLPQNPTLTLL